MMCLLADKCMPSTGGRYGEWSSKMSFRIVDDNGKLVWLELVVLVSSLTGRISTGSVLVVDPRNRDSVCI
jgi:hypothetical protein